MNILIGEELRDFVFSTDSDGLNEYMNKLAKESYDRQNRIKMLRDAKRIMNDYCIYIDMDQYDDAETFLQTDCDGIDNIISMFNEYLEEKRESCNHEWVSDGNDHNYEYYTCKHCGETEKR